MAEYIERGALIRYVEKQEVIIKDGLSIADAVRIQGNVFRRAVETCPAADVVEVRHGKWTEVWICTEHCFSVYECSVCGKNAMGEGDFCPHCGAKMDGKGEGE